MNCGRFSKCLQNAYSSSAPLLTVATFVNRRSPDALLARAPSRPFVIPPCTRCPSAIRLDGDRRDSVSKSSSPPAPGPRPLSSGWPCTSEPVRLPVCVAAYASSTKAPATTTNAPAVRRRSLRLSAAQLPTVARSMASPATRSHNQSARRCRDSTPTPLAISRSPKACSVRRERRVGRTPTNRATTSGASSSASPTPRLSQPRTLPSDSPPRRTPVFAWLTL